MCQQDLHDWRQTQDAFPLCPRGAVFLLVDDNDVVHDLVVDDHVDMKGVSNKCALWIIGPLKLDAVGPNFAVNITWERLILLRLSTKRLKKYLW